MSFGYTPPVSSVRPHFSRVISPYSVEAIRDAIVNYGAAFSGTDRAWVANLAVGYPFHVAIPGLTAYEGWALCGSGAGNNFDIGIVGLDGTVLTHSGATARSAGAYVATTTLTDYPLPVGDYYAVISCDSIANMAGPAPTAAACESMGMVEATSAYPLTGTLTLAKTTRAFVPMFGLTLRTVSP